ncbi:CDP-glycerol glycerophosphotransferase family protein, partial [Campylobacter coli]|uniref:CDP-glycerol glycerophosphotransferase family protein n=1 Tax=Campylobacter coli TaxID=195 RepID=UPI001CCB64DA
IYKENGGQASARNLGLKYMQENHYKTPWVTFTDPDDFLDRNYFYEVDKFLLTHQDDDICIISTNVFIYNNITQNIQVHPSSFKFQNGNILKKIKDLKKEVQSSTPAFFLYDKLKNMQLFFNEDKILLSNFEDGLFCYEYLMDNLKLTIGYVATAHYYYRKGLENSTTSKSTLNKDLYLEIPRVVFNNLYYKWVEKSKNSIFVQNIILYYYIFQIKDIINSPEKLSFMSENEKQQYLELLDQNFSHIDKNTIIDFNLAGCWFFHKVGILNCFKNEKLPFQIAYIEDYDPYKEQILITYYTGDDKDIESIRIDNEVIYADYEKIVKYDFLDRVFCYQKRLWVHIPKNAKDRLEILINGEYVKITFQKKHHQSIKIQDIRKEFQKRLPKSNIWLLMDRDYEADDNAEHLYRYIMQNHPEQEIVFALRKESSDWKRLEKEGFNLIEFGSYEFERIIKKASKVISSHLDGCCMQYVRKYDKIFVNLQHGVTFATDVSRWLNSYPQIKLMTLCCTMEQNNIATNYNRYIFSKKEAKMLGFARHDELLRKSSLYNEKVIFIMPTWRLNIVGKVIQNTGIREFNDVFLNSQYFLKWKEFLHSEKLKKLSEKFNYKVVFFPHFQSRLYLDYFETPSYISIDARNNGESLQTVFAQSSIMITDYTTAASEMAIQGKFTLYYQFDRDEILNGQHHQQEIKFNYDTDSFGPVSLTLNDLLLNLEQILDNKVNLTRYKKNMDTFVFNDQKCCERIYNAILELENSYIPDFDFNYIYNKASIAQKKLMYSEAFLKWKYLVQNSKDYSKDVLYQLLYCARKSFNYSYAIDFIESNNFLLDDNFIKKEYIRFLILNGLYMKALDVICAQFSIKKEHCLDFYLIQLELCYLANREELFFQIYKKLVNNNFITELELNMRITFFQKNMIELKSTECDTDKVSLFVRIENFMEKN